MVGTIKISRYFKSRPFKILPFFAFKTLSIAVCIKTCLVKNSVNLLHEESRTATGGSGEIIFRPWVSTHLSRGDPGTMARLLSRIFCLINYYSHLLRPNSMTVSSNCLCLSSGLNLTLGARYSLSSRLRANITDRELTLTRIGLIFKMNKVHYFTGNNKSEYVEYVFSRLWFHDVSLIAAGARDTRAGLTLVLWLVSCGARGSGQGTGCFLGNGS